MVKSWGSSCVEVGAEDRVWRSLRESSGPVDWFVDFGMVLAGFLSGVGFEVRGEWLDLNSDWWWVSGLGWGSTELLWDGLANCGSGTLYYFLFRFQFLTRSAVFSLFF
jgi:hypothetical protein